MITCGELTQTGSSGQDFSHFTTRAEDEGTQTEHMLYKMASREDVAEESGSFQKEGHCFDLTFISYAVFPGSPREAVSLPDSLASLLESLISGLQRPPSVQAYRLFQASLNSLLEHHRMCVKFLVSLIIRKNIQNLEGLPRSHLTTIESPA